METIREWWVVWLVLVVFSVGADLVLAHSWFKRMRMAQREWMRRRARYNPLRLAREEHDELPEFPIPWYLYVCNIATAIFMILLVLSVLLHLFAWMADTF